MIKDLDTVVLTHDIDEHSLKPGDVGAVVHVYGESEAFEVEFVTAAGHTVAVITLQPADVRPMASTEILHARELARSA